MMLSSSSCRLKNHPWSAFIFASALSWMVIDHEIHVNQVRSDSEALWPWSAAAASAVAAIPAATAAGAAAGSSASAAAAPRSQVPVSGAGPSLLRARLQYHEHHESQSFLQNPPNISFEFIWGSLKSTRPRILPPAAWGIHQFSQHRHLCGCQMEAQQKQNAAGLKATGYAEC